jgi:membrane fusion protein, multidrug efflux system
MYSQQLFSFCVRKLVLVASLISWWALNSCNSSSAKNENQAPAIPTLPVWAVQKDSATTFRDYTAALEGKINVEIRAQVDGYLDKIYVDEGTYVKAGQPLFKINDHSYQEQLNTAIANLHVAQANMNSAQIEIDKLAPLVKNNVVSEIQLKSANSAYEATKASVEQAKAAIASARINLNFSLIRAPVSGYIGRIPKRIGNLVAKNDAQGMTTLSDIEEIYAYFSLSEADFLRFNKEYQGNTLEEKIKKVRPVALILADGSVYDHPGRVDIVNGEFDKNMGSISLRARFPNPGKLLRSGNSGKIRMQEFFQEVWLVPVSATVDQQDKVFVYVLTDGNRVKRQAITISGKTRNNYIVTEGVQKGDTIVLEGLETLIDGSVIKPHSVNPNLAQDRAIK